MGLAGGVGLGILRYSTSRNARTALTWGATVGGLLYGVNWFVCRRAMYRSIWSQAELLQRVAEGDSSAMRDYEHKLEAAHPPPAS